jgi:hypothetical protein
MVQLLQAGMSSIQQHTGAVKVLLAHIPFMGEEIQAQSLEQTTCLFTRIFDFEGFLSAYSDGCLLDKSSFWVYNSGEWPLIRMSLHSHR